MPPRRQREPHADDDDNDELIAEPDVQDAESLFEDDNDENAPINDENSFSLPTHAPVHRSSSILALRTPLTHSRPSPDTALRDITDQFFHPPSPSPLRVSKRSAPLSIQPPQRPKKPRSLAYPADPPNWLYSRSSSSLPPSSPLPPSTSNFDHAHATDRSLGHRYEYDLGTPTKASDSDPFGFFAVERALRVKRAAAPAPAPRKPVSHNHAVDSPPRSTVVASAPSKSPVFSSFSQLDHPIPTNNEDIDGLYADEPIAGPSHIPVPVAPLLMIRSDIPLAEVDATHSQPTFPDPLRTPRKRKHCVSLTPDSDLDEEGTDLPSSPSPVKISVGASGNHRPSTSRPTHIPIPKLTRAQAKAAGKQQPASHASSIKPVKTSHQRIPTPSSTPVSTRPNESSAPPTPVLPRRSTRQAAVGARAKLKGAANDADDGGVRMKLRSRSAKVHAEAKTKPNSRVKNPLSKPTASTKTHKATTTVKPTGGRPKGKASSKNTKGKGKARPLEDVLGMSDETREKYEKERRERLEYFKHLEGYQMQKENVYVV